MLFNLSKMFLSRKIKTKIAAIMLMILMKLATEVSFKRNSLGIILMDSCRFGQQKTCQRLPVCIFPIQHPFTQIMLILYWVLSNQVSKL